MPKLLSGTAWIEDHVENFIKPVLEEVPHVSLTSGVKAGYNVIYEDQLDKLKTIWEAAKKEAGRKKILLAGRDVYLFYVLACLEGKQGKVIFRPDISTTVARSGKVTEDYSKCFNLDTGYKGTIPTCLKVKHWKMISFSKWPITDVDRQAHQILFPDHAGTAGLVSVLEGSDKYWTSGTITNGKITQKLAGKEVFRKAAELTMWVARYRPERVARSYGGRYL